MINALIATFLIAQSIMGIEIRINRPADPAIVQSQLDSIDARAEAIISAAQEKGR